MGTFLRSIPQPQSCIRMDASQRGNAEQPQADHPAETDLNRPNASQRSRRIPGVDESINAKDARDT
jgi:hypothetical protein